ncbi:Sarcosine oxidase alpha subunit protein [Minicystis rosea]|nr:Sarcosine oxidase alpha subunit protein [Minicystis rosea]
MFRRRRALIDPVTIHLDGEALPAERGESLAAALLAADKTIVARSPKLHRPRGPSCFRGGCDGCLARVDGTPNVMLCQTPAHGGEHIRAQNVIGSRKADLLRVTDWFFAKGIDHHHMLAGVPGLSTVMQGFAAKVAGLGRLPSTSEAPRPARRIDADVVVVGGGVAGIAAASALAAHGRSVLLVDDGLALGGALAGAPAVAADLFASCPLDGVTVLAHSIAAGCYDGELLLATASFEAILVRPRALVFATGAHDGTLAVPGNDLPGVFSARALCRLLHGGLEPDGPTAIVGDGFWADELSRALGEAPSMRFVASELVEVRGTASARNVTRRASDTGEITTHGVAAVALALPGAPSFELPAQAGAEVRFDPAIGYAVIIDERGRIAPSAWAVGECTGKPFDPAALRAEGRRIADDVHASL